MMFPSRCRPQALRPGMTERHGGLSTMRAGLDSRLHRSLRDARALWVRMGLAMSTTGAELLGTNLELLPSPRLASGLISRGYSPLNWIRVERAIRGMLGGELTSVGAYGIL